MAPKTTVQALACIHSFRASVLVQDHPGLNIEQAQRLKIGETVMVKDKTAQSLLQAGLVITVPVEPEPETETELNDGD